MSQLGSLGFLTTELTRMWGRTESWSTLLNRGNSAASADSPTRQYECGMLSWRGGGGRDIERD